MLQRISDLLSTATSESPRFRPTLLYNESWILRLVLDWVDRNADESFPIPVVAGAGWYSEALLPSAFKPLSRGDPSGEGYTNADGVLGHFEIGRRRKGDLSLKTDARQLSLFEGKMFSGLSKGVKRAPGFDQAARSVACIARVLQQAERQPSTVDRLSFTVVAPEKQIGKGVFGDMVTRESIRRKVEERVLGYGQESQEWWEKWFLPTLEHVSLEVLSWEDVLAAVQEVDAEAGTGLEAFYETTLRLCR